METLIAGFTLGNAAILTNVCLLPLYPGLIAFLAGSNQDERYRQKTAFLGIFVLLGVLSMMLLVGLIVYLLFQSFGDILTVLLPAIYVTVILLGLLMLSGRNPFARISNMQAPILKNPFATAYVYGLLLGPMTLPCTGPIITSAFAVGAIDTGLFIDQMGYFLAFGLGFGWPLIVLPLFAMSAQRRFTGWLNNRHMLLTRVSGILLLFIGVYGMWTEVINAPIV